MEGKTMPPDLLGEREKGILKRLASGLSDQEIADELFLSLHTVKWYNRQIYSKLGVKSRTQAIAYVKDLDLSQNRVRASPHPHSRDNLPAQTLLFLGRHREMAQVKQLLHASRLLTLTGTGGTGKTQLALRVAAELAQTFADGVCFVDLAPLLDHQQVAKAIASALGVFEHPTQPLPTLLKQALAGRELLLLLDNFEHVLPAAPLVSELLMGSSHLKVFVTSREPLRLNWEQEYLLGPLSLPSSEAPTVEHLTASEAGQLFVRRAQMALPHFVPGDVTAPVIAQICNRLGGLPLAIELAAARIKLFTPQALLERLEGRRAHSPLRLLVGGSRDAPPRQRTLRDSIEWSYHLLSQQEQRLLTRLAVFRGGSSLEAVESICSEDLSIDVLDGLASLVDKHLVYQKEIPDEEPRFLMLEMIQEYARERLEESGEEERMRRRHASYFVSMAERAEPELREAQGDHWYRQLELDLEDIRAVLSWSLHGGDVASGIRLAGALCLFWYVNGYHVEGHRWTQQLLSRLDEVPLVYQPRFLLSAGHMACMYDLDRGVPLFARALATACDSGDQLQIAWAQTMLGHTMFRDPFAAMRLVEESLVLFRKLSHPPGIAMALNVIGEIARYCGDDAHARHAYEECLSICRQTGETRRIIMMYVNLAFLAMHKEETERARDLAREALKLARAMNSRLQLGSSILALLAGVKGALGQPERAARLFGASEKSLERLGAFRQPNDKWEINYMIAAACAQLDEETFEAAWQEGSELTLEQAIMLALDE